MFSTVLHGSDVCSGQIRDDILGRFAPCTRTGIRYECKQCGVLVGHYCDTHAILSRDLCINCRPSVDLDAQRQKRQDRLVQLASDRARREARGKGDMDVELDVDGMRASANPYRSVASRIIFVASLVAVIVSIATGITLWAAAGDGKTLSPTQMGAFIVFILMCSACAIGGFVNQVKHEKNLALGVSVISFILAICLFAFMIADFSNPDCTKSAIEVGCTEDGDRIVFIPAVIYISAIVLLCIVVYAGISLYRQVGFVERRRQATTPVVVPSVPADTPEGQRETIMVR